MESSKINSTLRVALIEDSKHDRVAFHRALSKTGAPLNTITEFVRAEDALATLMADPSAFDIVVCDHGLPGMKGLDFLMEALKTKVDAPLVLLTGSGNEQTAIKALKSGVDDYIVKDDQRFYLDLLPETLVKAVNNYREKLLRKKAESALIDSETRYRTLMDFLPDGVAVHTDGKITFMNPAGLNLLGVYDMAEVLGEPAIHFVAPDYHTLAREQKTSVMSHGERIPLDHQKFIRPDGTSFDVEVAVARINYEGKPSALVVFRDITERKKGEERLRKAKDKAQKATKEKDKYISLIANDLRAPFTSIVGFIRLIMNNKKIELEDTFRQHFNSTLEQAQHAVDLIDNVLAANRFHTGSVKPNPRFLDGYTAALGVTANYSYLADDKGIALVNEVPEGMRLNADPSMLNEALGMLVANSIKFCESGDLITVFTPENEPTTIAVRDTGIGIDKKMIDDLFRFDIKTVSVGTAGELGTGLGLPLCREMIEAHGGTITVESTLGAGSTFYLRLPYVRPTVLVVDDAEVARNIAVEYFRRIDVDVVEAEDGFVALEVVNNVQPHLILLDLVMPRMDGIEVLKRLKRDQKTRGIPVIVVTSDDRIDVREHVMRIGADDFISKPAREEDLIPRARKFIC